MKAKFHAGDTVKIKKIYSTPVPSDLKDDPVFKLLKLAIHNPRHVTEGDEFKLKEALEPRKRSDGKTVIPYSYYDVNGKCSGYILWEDELELVSSAKAADKPKSKSITVEITIDLSDKSEAHRVAHAAVENAFKFAAQPPKTEKETVKDWTPDEIKAAREKVVELVTKAFSDGGDVNFTTKGEMIMCSVYPDSDDILDCHRGYSRPFEHDRFNVWIGKCVSICKAMDEPVPDFIRHKNTDGSAA